MEKKEIQDQRMRGYFIEATKEIIKGEGITALTVRNVADRAGYSYATLYNYFKDLRMLIVSALNDFMEECGEFIQTSIASSEPGENRISGCARSYINFFVQYPSIYQLAFIDKYNVITPRSTEIDIVGDIPDKFLMEDWNIWASENKIPKEAVDATKENFRLLINGLLLFYMNRRIPNSYEDMLQLLQRQLDFILKR